MTVQEDDARLRLTAWAVVACLHAGLLWMLWSLPGSRHLDEDPARTRLVLLERAPPPVPSPPPIRRAAPEEARRAGAATPPVRPQARSVEPAPASTPRAPSDWQRQARDWARQVPPSDEPDFVPDPLRSRRAQLPGGERGNAFRQRPPPSPAEVAKFIGQLFGAGEDPCLRARRQTSGLLTATSDRERERLAEELRRQRQYCGP